MESKSKLDKTWRETEEGGTVNNRKQMSENDRGDPKFSDNPLWFHGHLAMPIGHFILISINLEKRKRKKTPQKPECRF